MFLPCLREQTTWKNTVCSSVEELKSHVQELIASNNLDARHFQFDYSAMNEDNLWYLKTIQNVEIRDEIVSVAN